MVTVHELPLRVSYADTDQMGMVYYANYLVYFERGRTEWLRDNGSAYRALEDQGLYFPVIECSLKYHSPARYDDVICIKTSVGDVGPASVEFLYEISCDGRIIVTGKTKHPLVNKNFKPTRLPADLRALLTKKTE